MAQTCAECGSSSGEVELTSGRMLCPDCYRRFAGYAGAGTSLIEGHGVVPALTTGIATAGFADAVRGEAAAMAARRAKLEATTGFWRRLWVRIVG